MPQQLGSFEIYTGISLPIASLLALMLGTKST
jgi:hypothetical protein